MQHSSPAGTFHIDNLAVAAEYQNQSFGRLPLAQCIAVVSTASSIMLNWSLKVQNLDESLGLQAVPTKTMFFWKHNGFMQLTSVNT
ncbi:hypothetical protein AVDCRST_MAG81-2798 [uncultured Synechococcales cyanobacterium]|uniref:Uncharacterized protein n=1 Tax=uncultured Synechococcales cyanobacterium TaxID=1936017 RepID=A0A6J4VMS1_9CYAN|nr:hypothetical protein AVDCRST_MAG81-2798 [uncultured Synechococcales cyanobacterium]